MSTSLPFIPPALDQAGHALRQVLLRLHHYGHQQVERLDPNARHAPAVMAHVNDLQALLAAVEQYEQAALASLPPALAPVSHMSPAQLLAYREADPVYRLGWVRGHKTGVAQGQQNAEPALHLYAQHAPLPTSVVTSLDYAVLVQQVRAFLAQLNQRYGAGPITRPYYAPPAA